MRTYKTPFAVMALVAFATTMNLGCGDTPESDFTDETSEDTTTTEHLLLGDCAEELDCSDERFVDVWAANFRRLFSFTDSIFDEDDAAFFAEEILECMQIRNGGDPVGTCLPEAGMCEWDSALYCFSQFLGVQCTADIDCADTSSACFTGVCNTDTNVCDLVPVPDDDPTGADDVECQVRACVDGLGWGNVNEADGTSCFVDGCSNSELNQCMDGVCMVTAEANLCCATAEEIVADPEDDLEEPSDTCPDICQEWEDMACQNTRHEDGRDRCRCVSSSFIEDCFDEVDNDLDGDIDCEDSECSSVPYCTGPEDRGSCCEDDGTPGCNDPVVEESVCLSGDPFYSFCCDANWDWACINYAQELFGLCIEEEPVCGEGLSCDDPACEGDPACPVPVCGEGLSCDDPACEGDPACTPEPGTQRELADGFSVGCWAYVNPLTGSVPEGVEPVNGPTPALSAFSPLCLDQDGEPSDEIYCIVQNGAGTGSTGYGVPFFDTQIIGTAPACPGFDDDTFGCGSRGFESRDVICGE